MDAITVYEVDFLDDLHDHQPSRTIALDIGDQIDPRPLASSLHCADEKFPAPGALRSRSGEARALNEGVKSDDLVSDTVKDAFTRPERPEAAPYSFVQFGHNWFVVDPNGLRIGEAIKTAVQAQRLARQLSEGAADTDPAPPVSR